MKGKLIVVMGVDGAGKTTLVQNMEKCLSHLNFVCMSIFKNPLYTNELEMVAQNNGSTRREMFSKEFRNMVWKNDLILNTIDRVVPELENGNNVILDRYVLCNKVYSNDEDSSINRILNVLPTPDLGIYLDVDPQVALSRIESRMEDKAPYETMEGLIKNIERYKKLIKKEKYPIVYVNANNSEDAVLLDVIKQIVEWDNNDLRKRKIENEKRIDECIHR